MSMMHLSLLAVRRLLFILLLSIGLFSVGCGLLGGDDAPTDEEYDVCRGFTNQVITQDRNGLGVTSTTCNAAPRGEWIGEGCYCGE
ncbi:MAG: hypothetical protein R2834_01740 [Rhodothermales bacterium]